MQKIIGVLFFLSLLMGLIVTPAGAGPVTRLIVIDSYHPEYQWSRHVNEGLCEALLSMGYLENRAQIVTFTRSDYVKNSKVEMKRLWMDTKRKKSKEEQAKKTLQFTGIIKEFNPDLIFLGDDNAANYIGNQFLDTKIPMVFWGVNNTPVKYGLVDNKEKPGHNVTGVYQTTYYRDSLALLKKIVPHAETFAVLSDDTTTGRIHNKAIAHLDRQGKLPLKLVEVVATNKYDIWQEKAKALQKEVDAFFIASSNGLKDKTGRTLSNEEVAQWYLQHISIPEATGFRYRVEAGWLCAADDSGFNQGYEAAVIADKILNQGVDPATIKPITPKRGPLMVNKTRAKMLGITLTKEMGIEEYIELSGSSSDKKAHSMKKIRVLVVDSYHPQYSWSQDTNAGFSEAMLELRYFDNDKQVDEYGRKDAVETSRMVLKRHWMDTKRKSSIAEQESVSLEIYKKITAFKPDLVFLGDDNAAKYVGGKLLDASVPVVFWGVNNTPVKYGLVDSVERPGHNITGIYQQGYYEESFKFFQRLVPQAKTFAILADGTTTGRTHMKAVEHLARNGKIPLQHITTINTNDFEIWKEKALELHNKVDAFFVAHYAGLKDKDGKHVPTKVVTAWYLNNIKIPEVSRSSFVKQGLLCAAFDSGYNQGYEAVRIGHDIIAHGADPASYRPRAPHRGPLTVNRLRAAMLGITLTDGMGIEDYLP